MTVGKVATRACLHVEQDIRITEREFHNGKQVSRAMLARRKVECKTW